MRIRPKQPIPSALVSTQPLAPSDPNMLTAASNVLHPAFPPLKTEKIYHIITFKNRSPLPDHWLQFPRDF